MQLVNNYHGVVGAAYTPSHNPNTRTNFAASYVTGSHAFKTGIDLAWAERGAWTGSIVPYSYVVSTLANNGRGGPPGAHAAVACDRTAASIRWPARSTAG